MTKFKKTAVCITIILNLNILLAVPSQANNENAAKTLSQLDSIEETSLKKSQISAASAAIQNDVLTQGYFNLADKMLKLERGVNT